MNWKKHSSNGIYLDVNFDDLDLCKTPKVFTTVECTTNCWRVSGSSSVYDLSNNYFRVYLRGIDFALTPEVAEHSRFKLTYAIYSQD